MGRLTDRQEWIALAHCVEPADAVVGRLLAELGPTELLRRISADATGLRHGEGLAARLRVCDAERAEATAARCDARIVTRLDLEWPTQLDALGPQAPLALWVTGAANLRLVALRSVAVVGARACTPYGEEIARYWSAELAAEQWTVISGAAFGIDAAAHRGALAGGGTTIAVVAGGVDVPYPRAHAALLSRISDEGLVVSETPPGESVRRQRFLSRNRLIAGLSRATLVVEAAVRSGARSTGRAAGAMNRPVLAVPGPVTSAASAGCHHMIRDGEALLVSDVADLLDLLELGRARSADDPAAAKGSAGPTSDLPLRDRRILDAMPARGVIALDALVREAGLSGVDVLSGLGLLSARGVVVQDGGGWRLAGRAHP